MFFVDSALIVAVTSTLLRYFHSAEILKSSLEWSLNILFKFPEYELIPKRLTKKLQRWRNVRTSLTSTPSRQYVEEIVQFRPHVHAFGTIVYIEVLKCTLVDVAEKILHSAVFSFCGIFILRRFLKRPWNGPPWFQELCVNSYSGNLKRIIKGYSTNVSWIIAELKYRRSFDVTSTNCITFFFCRIINFRIYQNYTDWIQIFFYEIEMMIKYMNYHWLSK